MPKARVIAELKSLLDMARFFEEDPDWIAYLEGELKKAGDMQ